MQEQSKAMQEAVSLVRKMADERHTTVEEILVELERDEQKKIKAAQMAARAKRKQARDESELKKIARRIRNHQLIKMGAALSSVLGRTLTDDEYQKLFDFYSTARTVDKKSVIEYFADKKEESSS